MLSLSPFRRLVKDYFLICESYYQAIKTQPASKIEAIDMGRRGLHDEGEPPAARAAQGQDRRRYRHRPAPVHAALRAALEGLIALGGAADLPGAVLFACNHNAVRSPMAEAILKHLAGSRVYVELGRRARRRRRPVRRRGNGRDRHRHHPACAEIARPAP